MRHGWVVLFGILIVFFVTSTTLGQSQSKSESVTIIKEIAEAERRTLEHVDTKFSEVNTKFLEVNTKFSEVNTKIAEVKTEMAVLKTELKGINEQTKIRLNGMSDKIEDLRGDLAWIQGGIITILLSLLLSLLGYFTKSWWMNLRKNGGGSEVIHNGGTMKSELRQRSEVIPDYDREMHLKSDNAEAYNNLGHAKSKLEQYFEALSDYDKAIRLKPDFAKAYYNRGCTKRELGYPEAAIADFDMVIRLSPDDAEAYYNRGRSKSLSDDIVGARQDLEKALELDETFKEKVQKRLEEL